MAEGIFDKGFREILSSQLVSIIGGLIAGVFLAVYSDRLLLLPGMLLTLPAFLDMRGNISGSLSSRLSSGLFLGVIRPNKPSKRIIRGNFSACFLLAVVISLFLGLVTFVFNYFVLNIFNPSIILLFLIAGIIANTIEIPLTIFLTFYFFRKGHDPNNILGPFVTSSGDITSVLSLLIALVII